MQYMIISTMGSRNFRRSLKQARIIAAQIAMYENKTSFIYRWEDEARIRLIGHYEIIRHGYRKELQYKNDLPDEIYYDE